MLTINDDVYGKHIFHKPVIVDLINSKPVQRLKRIAQFGLPDKWNNRMGFSRYEHDVGVGILIARVGGSVEEQIAGLLHDVSHTAFSHVIDYVMGSHKSENFQDKIAYAFLRDSEIPAILQTYGYTLEQFRHLHRFTLLEQDIPRLCADRVDYCLRENASEGDRKGARRLAKSLVAMDGRMHFSSKKDAFEFGMHFIRMQKANWGSPETTTRYYLLADAIKAAMKSKDLTMDDFFTDDETVIRKLERSENPGVSKRISALITGDFDLTDKKKKLRYVDPTYIEKGKINVLSDEDAAYKKMIDDLRKSHA